MIMTPLTGGTHIWKGGTLVVSLRGVNFGSWFPLGCSGKNAILFGGEGLVLGLHAKKYKNKYLSVFWHGLF